MFDTIIVGSGPAGFTAGIYASRREMKALIIGKEVGGQMVWASEIENYPGFKSIPSHELILNMQEHAKAQPNLQMINTEVKEISRTKDCFVLTTDKEKYETKTIILAIGLSPRRLAISGEEKFTGKGVSYCATCDGPFYKGKTVAVIGGGNSALDAAEILSKIASKVYLIHRRDEFRGFESLVDEVKSKKNVEIILSSSVSEISGDTKVSGIKILNSITNEEKELPIDGLFVEVGRIANTDIVKELVDRDDRGQILVNEKCETSCSGIFAAGDVTQVPFKQITIACGQATIAALSAYQYLQTKKGLSASVILDRSVKSK